MVPSRSLCVFLVLAYFPWEFLREARSEVRPFVLQSFVGYLVQSRFQLRWRATPLLFRPPTTSGFYAQSEYARRASWPKLEPQVRRAVRLSRIGGGPYRATDRSRRLYSCSCSCSSDPDRKSTRLNS